MTNHILTFLKSTLQLCIVRHSICHCNEFSHALIATDNLVAFLKGRGSGVKHNIQGTDTYSLGTNVSGDTLIVCICPIVQDKLGHSKSIAIVNVVEQQLAHFKPKTTLTAFVRHVGCNDILLVF